MSPELLHIVEAVEVAYGVKACRLQTYKGEQDKNIRFDDASGRTWLIKVSDSRIGLESIHWQEVLLATVAEDENLPFLTPQLLRTTDDRTSITIHKGDGESVARVISWISGPLMSDVEVFTPALLRSLGEVSALLTRSLSAVPVTPVLTGHPWLIQRGPEVVSRAVASLADDQRSRVVRRVGESFRREVVPRLERLPWAVIHHDLHDGNLILDEDEQSVKGVIDFNDAAYAPRVSDIAIAAAYAMLRQDDPEESFRTVIAGYESHLSLVPEETEVVADMALMRLCMNWAQWQSRAQNTSDNEYALSRSQHTWPLIEHLVATGFSRSLSGLV